MQKRRLLGGILVLLLIAPPAAALSIQGSWTGSVSSAPGVAPGQGVQHPGQQVVENIQVGDAVSGSLRFELDDTTYQILPDPADSNLTQSYLEFTIDGLVWQLQGVGDPIGYGNAYIDTANDRLVFSMQNQVGYGISSGTWNFPGTGGEEDDVSLVLVGDGSWLPAGFTWDQFGSLDLSHLAGGSLNVTSWTGDGAQWKLSATVSSLAVPEPEIAALVGVVAVAFAALRKRRLAFSSM